MEDLREEIAELEARIEELAVIRERCRKIILASQAAIVVGGLLLVAMVFGVFAFDPAAMAAAIAAVIGGVVLVGSNASTAQQTAAALRAAELRRAELIDQIDLRPVGDGARPLRLH